MGGLKKPSLARRTILLVKIRVNSVCHLHQERQIFASKTCGTSPFISFFVEGGELDLARSVVAVLKNGGFNASDTDLMNGSIIFGQGKWSYKRLSISSVTLSRCATIDYVNDEIYYKYV